MDVAGVGLHWRESGEGRPMVFLHGLADSHRSLVPLSAAFGRRRRLLVDLPGHGLSDRPDASYTPEWHQEVVGAWWDRLGLEDVDLVAHSYGGAIAQLLMLSHREQVRSVTLIAPGGLGPEVGLGIRLMTLPGAAHVVAPFLGLGLRLVLRDAGLSVEDASFSAWMGSRPGTARAVARTARAAIDLGGQTRGAHERLGEFGSLPPMALLWGKQDSIIPVRQAHSIKRWLPNVDLRMYDRARHWPHLERPAEVVHDMHELLDRDDRLRVTVSFEHLPERKPRFTRRVMGFFRAIPRGFANVWRRMWRPRKTPPMLLLPADATPA